MKLIPALALLFACSHMVSQKSIVGPDGTKHKLIECGEVEDCYKRASELCGTYKIVNTVSETSGTEIATDTTIKLLVKCDEK